jgi:murein DD-endopeptidase MepM/ murein hydrolase activator NlpD
MISPVKDAHIPIPPSRLSYGYQRTETHKHQGIDLVAPLGTPVYAVEAGTVAHAVSEWRKGFSGYGRAVVIRGNSGRWFLYAHLNDVYAREGDDVLEGQTIATVGNTAFTKDEPEAVVQSGAHLHFEVSPTPYPQESEALRLDPVAVLSEKKKRPHFRRTRRGITLRASRYSLHLVPPSLLG